MCGICGIIDYTADKELQEKTVHDMCREMRHRGPDDEGIYVKNGRISVALGHKRLSIIDLSAAGSQPLFNEDKTVCLVFNGEIYNYKVLRKELMDKGHVFISRTDAEVIVHLYEEYGEDCIAKLRGMFAFAIWDERNKKLLLARDRPGKKPLLYYHNGGNFCFASEFSALLCSGIIPKEIRKESVDAYLTYGYVPAPFTVYKDVFKLPPAHMLILKDDKITVKPYWELEYRNKLKISEREAKEEILRLLEEAVSIRLYSDVPLGAFLSGGIDSSVIVALMSRLSGKRVKTFSIGFEDSDYDELNYARNIAKRYDTEHHEFIVKPNALEILPLLIERYGEPYADSSCIPTYYVSRETKRYVTVALNGDGGDESFAGYERYQAMLIAEKLQKAPYPVREIVKKLSTLLPDSVDAKNKMRRIRRFIEGAFLPRGERYAKWVGIFDKNLKKELYTEEFARVISRSGSEALMTPFFNASTDSNTLDVLLNTDVNSYLPNDLLVKVDITSMANSLEARSPFLDHKLMEFAASLPEEYKLKGSVKKYILKKTVKGLIPYGNIHRRKMGFGVPVGKWFRAELKDFLKEELLSSFSLNREYFNPHIIKTMIEEHIDAKEDYTYQLWALLMLELWHRRFID